MVIILLALIFLVSFESLCCARKILAGGGQIFICYRFTSHFQKIKGGETADMEADQKQQFQNISVLFAKMEIEFS